MLDWTVFISKIELLFTLQEGLVVNHDKIYYASFKKSFYVEVPEIARMTQEGEYFC